jgi:menaquinone-dependent protoporphyrinogen IX oxidase
MLSRTHHMHFSFFLSLFINKIQISFTFMNAALFSVNKTSEKQARMNENENENGKEQQQS